MLPPSSKHRQHLLWNGLPLQFFLCVYVFSDNWPGSTRRCSDASSPLPGQCCTCGTVWCSGLVILCVVMYLMVWPFALNHAGTTTVHTRLGTSIWVTSWPAHLGDCLPSVHLYRRFLNVFTVLLLTTSYGRAFQVFVILMGKKCYATDVLNRFTINYFPLFRVLSLKSLSKRLLGLTLLNLFRYLNTSVSCPRSLLFTRLMSSKSLSRCR